MHHALHTLKAQWAHRERRMLRLGCGGLMGLCALLSVGMMRKDTTVVLIPPTGDAMNIRAGEPSPAYVEKMALLAVHYLMDNTPGSVGYHHTQLLSMVSSGAHGALTAKLREDTHLYESQGVTTAFFPHGVSHGDSPSVQVKGMWRTFLAATLVRQEEITLAVDYAFEGTRFVITDWRRV